MAMIDDLMERPLGPAMRNGSRLRCPSCGAGRMFSSYIKVNAACPKCGEELHHQRADDAPAYFTIAIVGHIVVPGMLLLEQKIAPAEWVHIALWMPLTLALTLALLPPIKGALIGLQWAKRMHGFGGHPD
jgi:uncharacterized protein (DUF983 family)